jgi:prophage regulatory protein
LVATSRLAAFHHVSPVAISSQKKIGRNSRMTALLTGRRTLRVRQVVQKTGLSQATIWRLSACGEFPKPIKISKGCTVWLEHEIDEMLEAKAAERGPRLQTVAVVQPSSERGGTS